MSEVLKPCPFCGSDEIAHTVWGDGNWSRIACGECGVEMDYFNSAESAFAWWNGRVMPPSDSLAAQHDEGLAREAELRKQLEAAKEATDIAQRCHERSMAKRNALQQRLAEAEETLAKAIYRQWYAAPGYVPWVERGNSTMQDKARDEARRQLASPGCADGEKAE